MVERRTEHLRVAGHLHEPQLRTHHQHRPRRGDAENREDERRRGVRGQQHRRQHRSHRDPGTGQRGEQRPVRQPATERRLGHAADPGTTDTPWVGRLLNAADDPEAERTALNARQPHGRLVRPEEVAATIAFLALPGAASVTGSTITVDGGLTTLPGETTSRAAAAPGLTDRPADWPGRGPAWSR